MQWPLSVQPGPSSRLTIGGNGRVQLPSYNPLQSAGGDDQNAVPDTQGSYPRVQVAPGYRLQPQRYYNQQLPNQVGVTNHNLQYLANPDDQAKVDFYNAITRFNNLTEAQRIHELGQDKVFTKQDFQQLPATNAPRTNGKTQYFDGLVPNPSIKQRVEGTAGSIAKTPIKGGQVIFHFLQHIL